MKKRVLTLFLALVVCLGLTVPVSVASGQSASPDTLAQQFVNTALSMKGKRATDFGGFGGQSWCGFFIGWCAKQNNLQDIISPDAGTGVSHYQYVLNHGGTGVRFYNNRNDMKGGTYLSNRKDFTPQTGDIVLFTWQWVNNERTNPGWTIAHVAIVSSVSNGKINVIHGNWDGKVVVPGDRYTTSWEITSPQIYAYARPNWSGCIQSQQSNAIADGTYTLTPACAPNARLDVAGGSQANLANVQIYTDNGSNAQKWDIASLGNGYYKLTAKCSGRVLDAYYNNISSGQNIIQYPWDGGNYQQWKFTDAGDGYYYIIPRCNESLCLDVYSAYSSDGTNVQVYTANQSNAQKWKLTPVDATTGQTTPAQTTPVQTTPVQTTTRTEYRYGRYVYTDYRLHTCWCQTYMTKLFGGATLQYSDWSTTRYSPTGKGWSCGTCRGNHIGVDHYTNGKPWWAEYSLPDGDYFWEETRTVVVQN